MGPETADPLVALDDLTDPIPTPEAFAATYGGYKVGPWEAVRQYR